MQHHWLSRGRDTNLVHIFIIYSCQSLSSQCSSPSDLRSLRCPSTTYLCGLLFYRSPMDCLLYMETYIRIVILTYLMLIAVDAEYC